MNSQQYDALILISFGGPEGPDDVIPFLENVLHGRNVPRSRLEEVAEHYQAFGGKSPINDQNRALIQSLKEELAEHKIDLPVYWGNRNWHPFLADTVQQMAADGIKSALAIVTSIYSSYSSCRQYLENIAEARATVENAPPIEKLRAFFNHPGFIEPSVELTQRAIDTLDGFDRDTSPVLFTAHSIPAAMAGTCDYEIQLQEATRLVADQLQLGNAQLVYQSRSGPPSQPWLEPDVVDAIESLHGQGHRDVVLVPIGFLSDHMEVIYDLDTEAKERANELGMRFARAKTVGTHPRLISMIRELIQERIDGTPRQTCGNMAASHDLCPVDCCAYTPRRPT